jgi:hypothetical protein
MQFADAWTAVEQQGMGQASAHVTEPIPYFLLPRKVIY